MNKKMATALMIPVIAAGIGMAKAVDEECASASAILSATLQEECTLIFESGSIGAIINPATGGLDAAFTPKFKLVTNNEEHKLVMTATVEDNIGVKKNAFAKEGSVDYIVLGNTKHRPTDAAITNALGAAPAAASNDNVIAYPVTSVVMSGASTGSLVFDTPAHAFETTTINPAKSGTSYITLTTGVSARANTYSDTTDTAGVYKAELTLTAYDI